MKPTSTQHPTPYPAINAVLVALTDSITTIFGDNLIGLYLTGSLSYGDFDPRRSDIDLVAVVQKPATPEQLERLKKLHQKTEIEHPAWAKRIESQYVPIALFENILPPKEPRPYVGEGKFYDEAGYGNEWIINNYLLYHHGMSLVGPAFSTLIPPIEMVDVQKACIRDLLREWEPKIADSEYLQNGHYQSYVVLNVCRILYTVLGGEAGSKAVAAAWVKSEFPEWRKLIQTAEVWGYGDVMGMESETVEFIKFAVEKVSATALFGESG